MKPLINYMPRYVKTDYETDIEIGTRSDDGRVAGHVLYLKASRDRREIRVLTQSQALKLAAVLLETVSELQDE